MTIIHSKNVKVIQYLRGFSALAVLFFHSSETYGLEFNVGAAGVDIFFVLSGFVIWTTTAHRDISPGAFLRRRIIRIVPLYWLVTFVTAIALLWKPAFFLNQELSALNLCRSLLFLPEMRSEMFQPVVLQGWTLTYEMLFYLVFSLILLLPTSKRLAYNALLFIGFVFLGMFDPDRYIRAFANPMILEFVAGTFIAAAYMNGKHAPIPVAICLLLISIIWFGATNTVPFDINRLIRWGVPSVLIVAALVSIEGSIEIPQCALFEFFGDASFSIYMWQGIAGKTTTALLLKLSLSDFLMIPSVIILTVMMTLVAYVFLEKPMYAFLNSSFYVRGAGVPLTENKLTKSA